MNISPSLALRIEEEIAKLKPSGIGHVDYEGRKYAALPLFGTIGWVWLLRADGTLWRSDSDSGTDLEPLPGELHIVALAEGVARYPWLEELLPTRPVDAVICSACQGTGRIARGATFCPSCSALGWRPPDAP